MSFSLKPAVRSKVSLLIGLIAGTGGGKTYTAYRLATGLANGAKFAVIDTEAGRGLHYADEFNYDHGELLPPFRPESYIDAIMAADKAGYPVIVVDSMSHVWAGEGGILDWQEEELQRMAGDDWKKREAVKMASWIKPKMSHKKMVQRLLQVRAHVILCFRAEEKIDMIREDNKMKIVPKVTQTGIDGWVPICEKALPFELTLSFLLLAKNPGVALPIKLQSQHKPFIDLAKPIDEEVGRQLNAWSTGADKIDHTDELRALLKAANIPEADFLVAGKKSDLSQISNIAQAKSWIIKNNRATAVSVDQNAIKSDIPVTENPPADTTDEFHLSFEHVKDAILKADTIDVLEIAEDLIGSVTDPMKRTELRALGKKRAEQLSS